jgi:phosphoribosylformylglycinamidine (FGAM) synthase PurS component
MRLVAVLLAASCLLSAALAVQPDFDAREAVRQVHGVSCPAAGVEQSLDDGEFLIDTSGLQAESIPSVAFDGSNFLVVWQDYRNADSTPDIYGARVTPSGTVLDPNGFVISQAAGSQRFQDVAFGDSNFLVVWGAQSGGDAIRGARVSPQGVVLDPNGIAISPATNAQYRPAVSFDGTNFLVVWDDWRSGGDVCGVRVSQAGVVLDSAVIPISTAEGWQYSPTTCFDGTDYLVAWLDYRGSGTSDIYGARVTQAGIVLDPEGIPISTAANHQTGPAVCFDGTSFLTVWMDGRSGYWGIYGSRVNQAGVVLDPDGIVISPAEGLHESPAVSFDGANWLVVWTDWLGDSLSDTSDIYGARVMSSGTVLDEFPVVTQEGNQYSPALAAGTGSQMLLVYQGWTGVVGSKTYDTDRIWGKMDPSPGIEETMNHVRGTMNPMPTVFRGVLMLGAAGSRQNTGYRAELLDAAGRKVMELHDGANDVSRLSPGVYFVRREQAQAQAQAIRRVMIVR